VFFHFKVEEEINTDKKIKAKIKVCESRMKKSLCYKYLG